MKTRNYIFLFVLSLILAYGCREDEILIIEEETELPESGNVKFRFLVTDEAGDPISDAQILINSGVYISDTYTSDNNGVVITGPYSVPSLGLKLKLTALEYEPLVKVVNGSDDATISEKIVLFKAENTIIPAGGKGTINGGGRLSLPSSFIGMDGSMYSGDVTVKSKFLDPDNKDYLLSAPGDLVALNTTNEYQLLASLGMYMIELYDSEGGALELADGSTATIEFPIAEKHKSIVGDEIPLWYFDEVLGVWVEDGIAKVEGDNMIAEVSHFTWWNCDLPYDFTDICFVFFDSELEIMAGLEVVFSINGVSFGNAIVDANGNLIAKIPLGEIFTITYYIAGQQIGMQDVGPYGVSVKKEIINTDLNPLKIKGNAIDCNGNPVTNGYGYYLKGGSIHFVSLSSDGDFLYYGLGDEHLFSIIDINSNKIVEILISEAEQQADLDLGMVEVCEEEVTTKFSGYVLLDTDEDNVGDTPLSGILLAVLNEDDEIYDQVNTDVNGYYEFDALPGKMYRITYSSYELYPPIGAGDNSPNGDVDNEDFALGKFYLNTIVLQDEHDEDNDFLAILAGTGTISGVVMGDTNNDGVGDLPLEWASIIFDFNIGSDRMLVNADGTFSATFDAGFIDLVPDFSFVFYDITTAVDLTPEPDGDNGTFFTIPVVLYDGENDADNTYVINHDTERSALVMVLEDTDMDGIGDVPLDLISVAINDRISGSTVRSGPTNEHGVIFFDNVDTEMITASIINPAYEVIDIIDTSPDGDPLIVDGDLSKMEIDLEEGEWDAGNIFVVRKI